ncbi:hypothetical protein Q6335_27425, partial [Klebsiella pneumoniae]|uniref:hypothetical protein n=1 Tax=Klebsiella pneumoniae TaxID=573 RepID=UPI002730C6DF
LKVFNTEHMNQAVFAFRRYEDASLRYTGIESHVGLTHYGLYDTVVAKEADPQPVVYTCDGVSEKNMAEITRRRTGEFLHELF